MPTRPVQSRLARGRRAMAVVAASLSLGACAKDPPEAYGNVEAVEVVVASEASGQLRRFTPREGERIEAGATVGTIDTTTLAWRRRELLARELAIRARIAET